MAANNSDPIQDQLGEGGAGVRHEAEEEEVGEETSSAAAQATATTMLPRSSSRPQLDLSGAAIHGTLEDRNPTILLPNQSDDISHLALDIGGSLIKLVYFSRHAELSTEDKHKISTKRRLGMFNGGRRSYPILGGRLHFVKFETGKLNECLDFISSKQLHRGGIDSPSWRSGAQSDDIVIKATGGGAFKYADVFKERLGVSLEKEDEMDCLVAGANFLLKAIRHEAFTHMDGQKQYVQIDQNDLFPFLLVNVGSGVSIIKVDGHGKFQRVSGTNVGGGTYWGLGRLMTKCKSFDELLELSQRGDNSTMDMLVGDIYGGLDYSKIGLSASTIASSFGKIISENKELSDYRPEDISLSLLRMISYNIGQISYLNALRYGLKRIFFGGFFIRGHAYTMDTISFAVHFWSKGEAQAMFLRHEGFLGALGAFMSYEKHGLDDLRISWMEKFVQKGTQIIAPVPMGVPATTGMGGFERPTAKGDILRSDASAALNVGVLHLVPTLDVFPLLEDPKTYEPNTIDLDQDEFKYWFKILSDHSPDLVDKAVASEGGTDDAKRRGDAFAHAFSAHLARLMEEPAAYGKFGLANLLELREECLREFQFVDAYISIKQRENEASLAVLPDLLMELDSMNEIDDFDMFKKRMLTDRKDQSYKRALLFVDNSGADVVLGMLPLARELLRHGTEVVLVANSLPALNDVTANELPEVIAEASKHCGILRKAAEAGGLIVDAMAGIQDDLKDETVSVPLMVVENGCGSPCIDFRQVSSELAAAAKDADLLILEGMGRSLHTNLNARFKCDALKLAMVKNQRLAEKLFNGSLYDCICKFEPVP
ncbi:Pantothenate kinase 2 [Zea mays]|uniref:Pantothenate kinase 2 n=1 Tax=Zea mays TaxID=4577 RepID=A0A1D6I9T1_MAIZE|nr:Pantothenate kinase 2 [Zea mays]ONM56766.1 Pantothenate kinase 2 [Zea mays]ONM56769.1 Pantothenate kinase 2 [Zea mays]